jgi:hypothetical protein
MEGMQRAALCIPSLMFSSVLAFKKLQLVYYVEMKMSRAFSLVCCTCFPVLGTILARPERSKTYQIALCE